MSDVFISQAAPKADERPQWKITVGTHSHYYRDRRTANAELERRERRRNTSINPMHVHDPDGDECVECGALAKHVKGHYHGKLFFCGPQENSSCRFKFYAEGKQ